METMALDTGREAATRLLAGDRQRREGEAGVIEALCDLATCYRLDEGELIQELVERTIHLGGEGTPTVSEHLAREVAGLLGCTPQAAGSRVADAINLKYRHPRLFEAVQLFQIDASRALRAANRCHELSAIVTDQVTTRWLRRQAGLGWTAAFNLLDKLIIEADAELAAKRERKAREDRGVWLWGLFEGVLNLTGKVDVLDGRFLDARLTELAELLKGQFPGLDLQQRRAKALGLLANPALALALMEQAAQCELPIPTGPVAPGEPPGGNCGSPPPEEQSIPVGADDQAVAPGATAEARDGEAGSGTDAGSQPEDHWCWPETGWPTAPEPPEQEPPEDEALRPPPDDEGYFPTNDYLPRWLPPACPTCRRTDPPTATGTTVPIDKLRPTLGIAVHLHTDALGNLTGPARIDKAGHITTRLLAELLGEGHGINVKVHPVIDLPNLEPADRYTPSPVMRRAINLIFDAEPFPYSNRPSAGLDLDHTIAYQQGRPCQTRVGNLAPLSRGAHRAKTAGFWRLEQPEPGQLFWTSPLGYRYAVTPFGTLRL